VPIPAAPDLSGSTQPEPFSLAEPATDRFGHIEQHGVDYIPPEERHGRARELFAVWAAPNITYLYIVLGGVLVGLGLNVWQALGVVIAGNLFWVLVGILSVSGPASGTPSSIVMRAMFGIRGNRVNVAIIGWVVAVAYEAINLSVGSLATFALCAALGIHAGTILKFFIVIATAVVTLAISVYGHATIVRLSPLFTAALTLCVLMLAYFMAPHVNLHFIPSGAPHGAALLGAAFAGLTIIASGPLSWGTGADYARYLPHNTRKRGIIGWVTLGGFIPSVLLGAIGVLAATAIDMTDPQTSFAQILPAWFYPIFLFVIAAGSITNNVLTAYSSGLALQAIGIKASRAVTVFFDGVVGTGLALYALFISNFIDTLNNILALSVSLLGPSLAIYAVDIYLRRNRYDGLALHDETPASPFWFHHGINWAGVIALLVGTGVALLCVNTTVLVGPISNWLDGADISSITGPLVAAAIYAALSRRTIVVPAGDAS
jgi:nucleobase:cation symporter-1, NCS1 family